MLPYVAHGPLHGYDVVHTVALRRQLVEYLLTHQNLDGVQPFTDNSS